MDQYIIKTRNLKKVYQTENYNTIAIENINLSVAPRDFTAIMGPSGCGKSTLLNILGLLDGATSGMHYFLGQRISGLNESQRSKLRKGNIGFIFQNFNLIDEMSVYENIELPLLYLKVPVKERRKRINEILDYMDIAKLQDEFPYQISGGEQQRVALSRAIVFKPKLILADEPTGNLDMNNAHNLMKLLTQLNGEGVTIILVTHELEFAKYSKKILNMLDGNLLDDK